MYVFVTAGLLNAQTLLNKAAEMAADLELKLPPLNAPLVFQRTILELAMPQVSTCSQQLHKPPNFTSCAWSVTLGIRRLPVIAQMVCQVSAQLSDSIILTHLTLQTPKAITVSIAISQIYVTCFSPLLPPLLLHFCWSTEQLVFIQQRFWPYIT